MIRPREFLACLLDTIPDRIYFKDREGRFLQVSRAEAEYLAADTPEEVLGRTDFDYFTKELAQAAYEDEQRIMRTGEPIMGQVEKKLLLDGRTGWALVAKIPLRDTTGEIIGTCGISKDITSLKVSEEALQQANEDLASQKGQLEHALAELHAAHEELKAVQQKLIDFEKIHWIARLAFGVAHEIRNPLCTLGMGINALSERAALNQDESTAAILREMEEAIRRADLVMDALVDGAAASGVTINAADVASTVEAAVRMLKSAEPVAED